MDREALVEDQIESGSCLIDRLKSAGFDVAAAAWVKPAESGWRLYVVSREVDERGLGAAYRAVHPVVRLLSEEWISLSELKLIGTHDPVAVEIQAIPRRNGGAMPTRTKRPTLGGISIEEAYVYPTSAPHVPKGSAYDVGTLKLKSEVSQGPRPEDFLGPLTAEEEKDLMRFTAAGFPRGQAEALVRMARDAVRSRLPIPAGTLVKASYAGWWGESLQDDPDPLLRVEAEDGAHGLTHKHNTEPA